MAAAATPREALAEAREEWAAGVPAMASTLNEIGSEERTGVLSVSVSLQPVRNDSALSDNSSRSQERNLETE